MDNMDYNVELLMLRTHILYDFRDFIKKNGIHIPQAGYKLDVTGQTISNHKLKSISMSIYGDLKFIYDTKLGEDYICFLTVPTDELVRLHDEMRVPVTKFDEK